MNNSKNKQTRLKKAEKVKGTGLSHIIGKKVLFLLNANQNEDIYRDLKPFAKKAVHIEKKSEIKKILTKGVQKMKKTKLIGLMIIPVILFISVLTSRESNNCAQGMTSLRDDAVQENFSGSSEYYFKPAGDTKTWHVINRFSTETNNDTMEFNNSEYLLTPDSVLVVNDYVGVRPEGNESMKSQGFINGNQGPQLWGTNNLLTK